MRQIRIFWSMTGNLTSQSVAVRPLPNGPRESRCVTFACIIGLHPSFLPATQTADLRHTSKNTPGTPTCSGSFGDIKLWHIFNFVGKICNNVSLLTASKFEGQFSTKSACFLSFQPSVLGADLQDSENPFYPRLFQADFYFSVSWPEVYLCK